MRIAKLYDIPFVAFSSAAVYRAHEILSEDDHLEAHNVYSASKISMEATLRTSDYAKIFIFRIPMWWGSRPIVGLRRTNGEMEGVCGRCRFHCL